MEISTVIIIALVTFLLGFIGTKIIRSSSGTKTITAKGPPDGKSKKKEIKQTSEVKPPKDSKEKKKELPSQLPPSSSTVDHALLYRIFRGHQADVEGVEVTRDGRLAISVSKDRTIHCWRLDGKEKNNTISARVNVNLNQGTAFALSQDAKKSDHTYIAVALELGKIKPIHVYGVVTGKKDEKPVVKFLHSFETTHKERITSVCFAPNAVITTTEGKDTPICFWTPKGELVQSLNSNQIKNNSLALSPDGTFVAAATSLSGVKIWQLKSKKDTNKLERVEHVMSLKGHNRGTSCVAFGPNNETMATISFDGTWRLWKINVQFKLDEDPKQIYEGVLRTSGLGVEDQAQIAISPVLSPEKKLIIALTVNTDIRFYNSLGKLLGTIETAHRDLVRALSFTPNGEYLASTGGDKSIKIWIVPKDS